MTTHVHPHTHDDDEQVVIAEAGDGQHKEVVVNRGDGYEHREEVVHNVRLERNQMLRKATQFVWLAAGILEMLLATRVILRVLAANPAAGFADFIYTSTYPFLIPFFGLVGEPAASNGSVLELSSLIAMLVYAFLAWVVVRVLYLIFDTRSTRTVTTYERHRV